MSARLRLASISIRRFSSKQKMRVSDQLEELLTEKNIKHRNHPGIVKPRLIDQPAWLTDAARTVLNEEHMSKQAVVHTGEKLQRHLSGRHPPQERDINKVDYLYSINEKTGNLDLPVRTRLDPKVYNWKSIEYNKQAGLAYLSGRGIPDYMVLSKIFKEIQHRDPNFHPRTLFDFASGIGTVVWSAANLWSSTIKEYICVDTSAEMIDLAERLLKHRHPQIRNVFYRQHLPAAPIPTYDIVVSAYGLLELPSLESRLETLSKLWAKTEQYLVIVELGTNAGFEMVNEARDFILNFAAKTDTAPENAYVFAPCPHEHRCPRYWKDDTPCNFHIHYTTLPISGVAKAKQDLYSYVVIKKGHCPENFPRWPRIVRPLLKRSSHVICRLCVPSGDLKEEIFTAYKNGRNTYRCARSSVWGDRLPFHSVKDEQPSRNGEDVKEALDEGIANTGEEVNSENVIANEKQ